MSDEPTKPGFYYARMINGSEMVRPVKVIQGRHALIVQGSLRNFPLDYFEWREEVPPHSVTLAEMDLSGAERRTLAYYAGEWVQQSETRWAKGDLVVQRDRARWSKKQWYGRRGEKILRGKIFADSRPGTGGPRKFLTAEAAMRAVEAAKPEEFER